MTCLTANDMQLGGFNDDSKPAGLNGGCDVAILIGLDDASGVDRIAILF
ncbi:MAG: hypothetical protein ACI9G1_000722 [Pirellulaceae bacterium]|jgi:hypothetical protein